jgi:adenylate kinase family enzyme
MKKFILSCYCLGLAMAPAFAQKTADPVLFTFGNSKVSKSEFLRMYTKNITSQKPDYSEKALREYLTLYSRFKMKVAEAEKVHLDTLPNIETELGSYKKQLAKTYMTDGEITDKLVKEAYERMKKDVRVSHILLSFPKMDEDTTAIYRRIDSLYSVLQKGMDFAALAAAAPGGASTKFAREAAQRALANVAVNHSRVFTVHSAGEYRLGDSVSRAQLETDIFVGVDPATGSAMIQVIDQRFR